MSLNAIRLGLLFDLNEQFSGLGLHDVEELEPLKVAIDRFDHVTSEEDFAEADVQRRKFLRGVVDIAIKNMANKPLREAARAKFVNYGRDIWKLTIDDDKPVAKQENANANS
jgi:hypothetical protein